MGHMAGCGHVYMELRLDAIESHPRHLDPRDVGKHESVDKLRGDSRRHVCVLSDTRGMCVSVQTHMPHLPASKCVCSRLLSPCSLS